MSHDLIGVFNDHGAECSELIGNLPLDRLNLDLGIQATLQKKFSVLVRINAATFQP